MITITATKENGEIVLSSGQLELLSLFIKAIPEGSDLQVTYELVSDDKSYAQLSKVHKNIRELAAFTGHTFEEMKKLVKDKAGLINVEGDYRSFAHCSKEELSQAIQASIVIGEKIGCFLY